MEYVEILDTTLRDGEQMKKVFFDKKEKLIIAEMLLKGLNADRIEICSARVSKGELEAAKSICKWAAQNSCLEKVEMLGFIDNDKSAEWISKAGGRVLNLLAKGSLKHLTWQLKKTAKEHFSDIADVFTKANKRKIKINAYLEDWSNGIKDSRDYVFELTNKLIQLGVKRIILADTLGILSPKETSDYTELMVKTFPGTHFDFHAHNDYGLATANSLAAILAGAKGVHATCNGLGERAGNTHLAEICVLIRDKTGLKCKIDEKFISKVSKMVERFSGVRIPVNKPIVGENVFTQTAGVHADGDIKGKLYVSKLTSERFGKEREYTLGKLSGKASLEQNLKKLDIELTKEEKEKVLERIVEMGDKKRQVLITDLPFIISDVVGTPLKKDIKIINTVISSGFNLMPNAALTVSINGKKYSESATGNGGYDAFMNALKKIFTDKLKLKLPKLEDYEVIIPPGGKTSALVETQITWQKNGEIFATIGIDPDQLIAAAKATEKMLNIAFKK